MNFLLVITYQKNYKFQKLKTFHRFFSFYRGFEGWSSFLISSNFMKNTKPLMSHQFNFRKLFLAFSLIIILASCAKKTCPTYMSLKEFNAIREEQMEREMRGKKVKKTKRDKWGRIKKPKHKKERL